MKSYIINARDTEKWKSVLKNFGKLDCSFLPEYHLAYCSRDKGSQALLYVQESDYNIFAFPFILNEIPLEFCSSKKKLYDISSVYGYSGPLIRKHDPKFLYIAWNNFDLWALDNNIICEFTRFSFYNGNRVIAHPETKILSNRTVAINYFNMSEEAHKKILGPKTRNMIAKARLSDLKVQKLNFKENYPQFKKLYDELMLKNSAPSFFFYDDDYYKELAKMDYNDINLFGIFRNEEFVGAVIIIRYGHYALYHLGAVKEGLNSLGCSNFYLFELWKILKGEGLKILNLGGGRTTALDDPLLKFKLRNSNGRAEFEIGLRVINKLEYEKVKTTYVSKLGSSLMSPNLQFYRS